MKKMKLLPTSKKLPTKVMGLDIIPVIPFIPTDYDTWEESDPIDYLDIKIENLKQYLLNWLKENNIDKFWLRCTTCFNMPLLSKKKTSESFIEIYVDNPNTPIYVDVRMEHKHVCNLPLSFGIEKVEKIINEIIN
jgi:hypothetical protein